MGFFFLKIELCFAIFFPLCIDKVNNIVILGTVGNLKRGVGQTFALPIVVFVTPSQGLKMSLTIKSAVVQKLLYFYRHKTKFRALFSSALKYV